MNIYGRYSHEDSLLGEQNRPNESFPLLDIKTSQSGSLPSWLKWLPLGHELFNSLEMGVSQPGQQCAGLCPSKGKLLPVMTFFHLHISHYAPAIQLNPKPGSMSHLMLPNSSKGGGWEAGSRSIEEFEVCWLVFTVIGKEQRSWGALESCPSRDLESRLPPAMDIVKVCSPAEPVKEEKPPVLLHCANPRALFGLWSLNQLSWHWELKGRFLFKSLYLLQILKGVSSWAVTSREVCNICLVYCMFHHTLKYTSQVSIQQQCSLVDF